MVVTSTDNYLPYGTACVGCGGLLIAPVCSKYVTLLQVRHVWTCDIPQRERRGAQLGEFIGPEPPDLRPSK
jgi:hypothetical protein